MAHGSNAGYEGLHAAMFAQLRMRERTIEQAKEDYQTKIAEHLLRGGICLIPSDDLEDNQYIVSRGVYNAAKRISDLV